MKVLVINAGSSSLKYQLLDPETGHLLAKGLCERIGIDGKFTYKPQVEGKAAVSAADVPMPTHSEAIQAVLSPGGPRRRELRQLRPHHRPGDAGSGGLHPPGASA